MKRRIHAHQLSRIENVSFLSSVSQTERFEHASHPLTWNAERLQPSSEHRIQKQHFDVGVKTSGRIFPDVHVSNPCMHPHVRQVFLHLCQCYISCIDLREVVHYSKRQPKHVECIDLHRNEVVQHLLRYRIGYCADFV